MASLAFLLALLVFLTFLTYRRILVERRSAEIDNAVALARTLAAEVDRFVNDLETTTLAIALVLGNEDIPLRQATVGPYFKQVVEEYGFIRAFFVTDPAGRVTASASGEGIGLDLSSRPYVQALMSGRRSAWSESLSGIQTGQITIAFARVIPARGGGVRGYLVTAFYPVRLIAKMQVILPEDARLSLIDRRGFVMHTTYDPALPTARRDLSSFAPVQAALRGQTVRLDGQGLPFAEEPRFGALVRVSSTGWVVGFTRPLEPLEAMIRASVVEQAALQVLGVILVGLLFGVIMRGLIHPLQSLAETATAIARGERPQIPQVEGPVETVQLAAGMRAMAASVAEREDRLRGALESERAAREAAEGTQAHLTLLTDASSVLASSLDYEETLRNIARLAVPHFADWCAVDLVDEDGRPQRLAVTHVNPAKVELAYEITRRYPTDPDSPTGMPQVLRTGKPQLIPEISEAMLEHAARDAEHLRFLREIGLVSAIIVPLTARGEIFGAISFVWAESGRRYSEEDLQLALDLARRAAVAIDNARMFHRERNIAETLQRSLLRAHLPEFPGMTIASRYLPARQEAKVGGDWYDALPLPDGRVGLVMGDVAGRGIRAAAVMGQLQNAVRAYAIEGHPPSVILERVARLLDYQQMATLLYVVFDPATWRVRYANAGHMPPLVLGPDGGVTVLEGGSPPLGGAPEASFQEVEGAVLPGSTIVLYTDGLIEVRGEPIDKGLDRLMRAASQAVSRDPEALLDHLVTALLGGGTSADDVALLALHADTLDPSRLHLRLDAAPPSLPLLRSTLRRWLEPAGITAADIFEVTVAASEAFANAVEHAYDAADAQIEVEGELQGDELRLTIRDWGQWRQPRGTNRGRGLGLMRGLMDDVQVTPGPTGTVAHMRRRIQREVHA